MTEGPKDMQIIILATVYRANHSGKENLGHECKTGDQPNSKNNSTFKITEDENKSKGLGKDKSEEEDKATWRKAFKKLRPPPKIKRRKPANPERAFNHKCKEIVDLMKPLRKESQQRKNGKAMVSKGVRRLLSENCSSRKSEDHSEFIVQHESKKTPTSPFPLKF